MSICQLLNCPICLQDVSDDKITKTTCDHSFCSDCLNTWLENKHTCPMCRNLLRQPSENNNNGMGLHIDTQLVIDYGSFNHSTHFENVDTIQTFARHQQSNNTFDFAV